MQTKSHTLKAVYKHFKEHNKAVPFVTFSEICGEFNTGVMEELLQGKEFNMRHNMGHLSVLQVARDPNKQSVNWGETWKYKRELLAQGVKLYDSTTGKGAKWQVYYTDKYYYEYHWSKYRCKRKNKSAYRFEATRGIKGNKEKLVSLLQSDDLAYLRFKKYKR